MDLMRWWRDLSVSKKLYGVVGVMAVLIALELFTLLFAMNILSAVRALVGGEGLWSKSQKNSILEIQNYIITRDTKHYQRFLDNLEVQIGDRQARLEMFNPNMNLEKVYEGFIRGRIHPQDVPPMVRMIRRFHNISYVATAIKVWGEADDLVVDLVKMGEDIHQMIGSAKPGQSLPQLGEYMSRIAVMNDKLTILEDEFSFALGEGSRWLENTLMFILLIAVLTVESTGLFLTFKFSQTLTRVLRELNSAANKIGAGQFDEKIPVHSADELGQLAMSLNKMSTNLRLMTSERAMAEEANQVKNLFLANMSHEIRTPLGAMLGFVELLKDADTTEPERKKYLDIISRTGDTLVTIINDILDLSKVEAGKIEIHKEPSSLNQILRDLELLLQLRCEGKGIFLKFEAAGFVPNMIFTDPMRLRQILLNIVGNAIKFTSHGGVTVNYRIQNGQINFRVTDTGVGIPEAQYGKLFKPFSQGDLSIRKVHGGTGLGLTLSQKLARLLGGDVYLEKSAPGQGSTFVIQVPAEESTEPPRRPVSSTPSDEAGWTKLLAGKYLLLVEDAIENQMLITHMLSKTGAKVDVANNGLEGMNKANAGNYDLIIMDMQMPVLDGYSATQELRQGGYVKPIVALTAHAMKEDLNKCLEVGCDDVLTKPVKRALLVEALARQLTKNGP